MTKRVSPPSGYPPPERAVLPGGTEVWLDALARESWELYFEAFPDEVEQRGPAAADWCVHDGKWLMAWAAGAERGDFDLDEQVSWLARVLGAREFPLERLARYLEILGDIAERSNLGPGVAARLRASSSVVLPP